MSSRKPERISLIINSETEEGFNARERIEDAVTPELVIALCGPLGTPLHRVGEIIQDLLRKNYGYKKVEIVRLSNFIRRYGAPNDDNSISDLIDAGNRLREKHGRSVLAQLAIKEIATDREKFGEDSGRSIDKESVLDGVIEPAPVARFVHIIDSIKNSEELDLLKSVYGKILHVISVFSPISHRASELEKKLGAKGDVYALIDRDSGEEIEHGQSVRDVFPLADFFLRIDDSADDKTEERIRRYLDLLLGVKIITPSIDERAMYEAHAAARNSACLSRQVGASLTDQFGNLLSVGWNDVPRAFGGLYELCARPGESDYVDHRCWNMSGGFCSNDREKKVIAVKLTDALIKENIVNEDKREAVFSKLRRSSELKGLIEFSRAVHAEMHALLNAGRSAGDRIASGRLYVTTYPCHSCARHIIAAGVKEVRFIEPYRKSLATRLHDDSITESESDKSKVRILPFDGVAPARFLDLFTESKSGRKGADGKMKRNEMYMPVASVTLEAVTTLESLAVKELKSTGLLE